MSDLLNLFMSAQLAEEQCDNDAAAKFYTELISMADNNNKIKPVTDEDFLASEATPPAGLIVSTALTSLGGLHLDASRLEDARSCFVRSLEYWKSNGMALLNLGDLEREHGSLDIAVRHYAAAAALPPIDDDDEEENGESSEGDDDDEDEDEEDEGGWLSQWVAAPRVETVGLASYMSALLHHQALQFDEALPYLRRFARLRYRLSPALWKLASRPPSTALTLAADSTDAKTVRRFDGCVPPPLLSKLQEAFSIDSPFWKESGYAERGYFSFWHDSATQPRSLVDALAHHLLPLTGCEDSIVGCEWWVHTRAEGRSIGHQMHFDTEEFTLSTGEVLHPLVSSVTYLNGSICADATVVLEQTVEDENGCDAAYVSHPLIGSTLFFPGDRLHCVVPAAPVAAAGEEAKAQPPKPSSSSSKRGQKRPHGGGSSAAASSSSSSSSSSGPLSPLMPSSSQPQRVTLMIGFWGRPVNTACRRQPYDACGPVPRPSKTCTWPTHLALPTGKKAGAVIKEMEDACAEARKTAVCKAVPRLDGSPWQRIKGAGEGSSDGWSGLAVPEARNHRFFVASLAEFKEQIFNPPPIDG